MNIIDTKINGGFWKKRKELNKNTSLFAVMKSFEDTGRVNAMTGDNDPVKQRPHIFWESDLAKLMEGAFFSMQQEKDEDLEKDYKRLTGELKKGYWILGHVLVEESQHLGQIAYIRGMIKGLNN